MQTLSKSNVHVSDPYQHLAIFRRKHNYTLEPHDHPYFQVILILDGRLIISHHGVDHQLRKGHLCIIPPNQEHALYSPTGYTQFGVDLNAAEQQPGIVKLLSNHIKTFTVWEQPELIEQISEQEQYLFGVTLWASLITANLLNQILLQCVGTLHETSPFRDQLLNAIKKCLHTKFKLSHISRELGLSKAQLERNCHREFGCSVMELYHRVRVNRACSLLVNPELSMEQISEWLGFYDQAHFSRFFKQRMQITPSQYRKKH